MLKVGAVAPRFECRALLNGDVVDLDSSSLLDDSILVILFAPFADDGAAVEDLAAIASAAHRFECLQAKVAAVCEGDAFEIQCALDRAGVGGRVPVLIDADGEIASRYDMLLPDGAPLWGQCIIDAFGIVRQFSQSTVYTGIEPGELERCIEAILQPTAEWPC